MPDICSCKKPMKRDKRGLLIPCAHCIDDAIQKVLVNLNIMSDMGRKQNEILKERRTKLIFKMEAKPNVRKIEARK